MTSDLLAGRYKESSGIKSSDSLRTVRRSHSRLSACPSSVWQLKFSSVGITSRKCPFLSVDQNFPSYSIAKKIAGLQLYFHNGERPKDGSRRAIEGNPRRGRRILGACTESYDGREKRNAVKRACTIYSYNGANSQSGQCQSHREITSAGPTRDWPGQLAASNLRGFKYA